MLKKIVLSLCLSIVMTLSVQAKDLEQSLSIYGWLPSFDGKLTFKVPTQPDDSIDSGDLTSIDSVFMGSYEIRNDKWLFLTDLIYLKMSGAADGKLPTVKWDAEMTTKIFGFYGGYNLSDTGSSRLDVIAGVRYFSLAVDVTRSGLLGAGTLSSTADNYDAIIGLKGHYSLNENWYVPYEVDMGTGNSAFTWQANASLGYRFGWGDVLLTYRYLHYKTSNALLVDNFDLYGPKLGVVFHF